MSKQTVSGRPEFGEEVERLRAQLAIVEKFINERPEYMHALNDASADADRANYYRWTGNAEARRHLATDLDWTVPHEAGDKTQPKALEEP